MPSEGSRPSSSSSSSSSSSASSENEVVVVDVPSPPTSAVPAPSAAEPAPETPKFDVALLEFDTADDNFLKGTTQLNVDRVRTRVELRWSGLSFDVLAPQFHPVSGRPLMCKKPLPKTVLRDVSGAAFPGEVLAIMGPSGAGKTTLLNVLAGRGVGILRGDVTVNGQPRDPRVLSKLSGFVTQDDTFFASLTVKETLFLSARLKTPSSVPTSAVRDKVDEVLAELSLEGAQNTRIGNEKRRGISGGERKRVAIGEVLAASPSVIFLDEPTSGLDSTTALSVMETLRMIARAGHTVVTTIHQPRSNIFSKIDRLLLLADGRVVFNGPAASAISYFGSLEPVPYPCPTYTTPTDYFLDLVTLSGAKEAKARARERVRFLTSMWGRQHASIEAPKGYETPPPIRSSDVSGRQFGASCCVQFGLLFLRAWRNFVRQPAFTIVRIMASALLAIIVGLIFLQLGYDQNGIQNRTGALFFIMLAQAFNGIQTVLNSFPNEKVVMIKERSARMYRVSPYVLSKFMAELIWEVLAPSVYVVIAYWMIGFASSASQFFIFLGTILLVALASSSLGFFIGSWAPNGDVANAVAPLMIVIFFLFGGFYLNDSNIPVYFVWLKYISYIRYAFQILLVNEFTGATFSCTTDQLALNGGSCPITTGAQVIAQQNFTNVVLWHNALILIALIVAFRLLAYIFLRITAKPKFMKVGNGCCGSRPRKQRADAPYADAPAAAPAPTSMVLVDV